jgi:hypothetical protein
LSTAGESPVGESPAGGPAEGGEPSEAELRAAYEAELARITSAEMVLQAAVSLLNLGGRRLGLGEGGEAHRDLPQVRDAIDAVRGLLPVLERAVPQEIAPLRDALSQLQMAYAREVQGGPPAPAGAAGGGEPGAQEPAPDPGAKGPGPAESSGRLWVPGR